ncbi:uncharacterized protein [Typha latifolia]|uniref:uncharacterized protein isoform X1 n=1 Tax=Typha latifolia TaxID=4733 RepID=UPI003C3053F5
MANAIPPTPRPPPASHPLQPPIRAMAASATPPEQLVTATAVNSFRLGAVADRLSAYFHGSLALGNPEFFQLCYALARGIDYALSCNDVPPMAHRIPALLKKVYQRRSDSSLQSALMVLFISAKSACTNGWFEASDSDEILGMAKELFSSFCMSTSSMTVVGNAFDTIAKIMSRFYPQLKLGLLVISFEVKHGYNILMTDFYIQRNIPPDERIRLFVAQTDNLETSSCIISPSQVSFLVNGKAVERRTTISLDTGPQFPTDITKMLKYGTNIIQSIGYFNGNYIIAIAFMSKLNSFDAPILEDYVQPAVAEPASDAEIVEGPSRVSLNCPISFKRIKTPVRGHLCKHHQCFDYDNYMEINSRKPSWRCPCCNTPISISDLRIDRNMVKILQEVGDDTADVVMSANGYWKIVLEQNGSINQLASGKHAGQKDRSLETNVTALPDVVDLTMEEDDESTVPVSSRQLEPSVGRPTNLGENTTFEMEDRKPIMDYHGFITSDLLPDPPSIRTSVSSQEIPYHIGENDLFRNFSSTSVLNGSFSLTSVSNGLIAPVHDSGFRASGTLSSLVPDAVLNPVITDSLLSAFDRDSTARFELSQSPFSFQPVSHARQLTDNMQSQLNYGDSMISNGGRRSPLARHVDRIPFAVQALPVPTQTPSSSRRLHGNLAYYNSTLPSGLSSASLPSLQSTASLDRFGALRDMGLEQMPRIFNAATPSLQLKSLQNRDGQDQQNTPSGVLQQVVGLPAPNQTGTGTLPEQLRGVGAYRSSLQLPSEHQTTGQIPNQTIHHSTTQPLNVRQTSGVPSTQVSQASQNAIGATVGSLEGHRGLLFAAQHGRLLADGTAVHSQTAHVPSSAVATADRSRTIQFASDGLEELPSEQHWRPTGRMRGSLTGDAYSAALNQYLSPPAQSAQARPPASVAGSNPNRLSSLISSGINPHALVKQQPNKRLGDVNSQQGSSNR